MSKKLHMLLIFSNLLVSKSLSTYNKTLSDEVNIK